MKNRKIFNQVIDKKDIDKKPPNLVSNLKKKLIFYKWSLEIFHVLNKTLNDKAKIWNIEALIWKTYITLKLKI